MFLYYVFQKGYIDIVRMLFVCLDVDINVENYRKEILLYLVVREGWFEVVKEFSLEIFGWLWVIEEDKYDRIVFQFVVENCYKDIQKFFFEWFDV